MTASRPVVEGRGVDIAAPGGRLLFRELDFALARERVAVVGRNGAGKSTLLAVLAGELEPARGRIRHRGAATLVAQRLEPAGVDDLVRRARERVRGFDAALDRELEACRLAIDVSATRGASHGELRKLALAAVKLGEPELLLLDEPTQDLDEAGVAWLDEWLWDRPGATAIASHDRRLLARLEHFFICSESGSRLFRGTLDELEADFAERADSEQQRYFANLRRLADREQRSAAVASRRRRKKNLGRIHELRRAPSRAKLNENRSYAQESQGKRAALRRGRLEAARAWTRATRRALAIALELELEPPVLPEPDGEANVELSAAGVWFGERTLFRDLDLRVARERVAVVGPNGAGKTTLLELATGDRRPTGGAARVRHGRVASIAQGARDWCRDESLLELLADSLEESELAAAAELLVAHRFPLGLAERPLRSLSPGERVRAALLCLFRRRPEVLIVDEPTGNLDLVGTRSLADIFRQWPGGLLVASHDRRFLDAIGIEQVVALDGAGGHRREGR
jgi:ATPase subunit of ABC transporter with duplicated ATPase domains